MLPSHQFALFFPSLNQKLITRFPVILKQLVGGLKHTQSSKHLLYEPPVFFPPAALCVTIKYFNDTPRALGCPTNCNLQAEI